MAEGKGIERWKEETGSRGEGDEKRWAMSVGQRPRRNVILTYYKHGLIKKMSKNEIR